MMIAALKTGRDCLLYCSSLASSTAVPWFVQMQLDTSQRQNQALHAETKFVINFADHFSTQGNVLKLPNRVRGETHYLIFICKLLLSGHFDTRIAKPASIHLQAVLKRGVFLKQSFFSTTQVEECVQHALHFGHVNVLEEPTACTFAKADLKSVSRTLTSSLIIILLETPSPLEVPS